MTEKSAGYHTKQKARILSYFEAHPHDHFTAAQLVQAGALGILASADVFAYQI